MVTLLVCVAVTSAATEPQFLYYFISIISRSALASVACQWHSLSHQLSCSAHGIEVAWILGFF